MVWSSNLAYAVGLLATDGNLSKDGRHINLRSSDIDLLEAFNASLNLKVVIRQSYNNGFAKKPSYRIQFSNVKLYRWLVTIGLFPAKTYTLGEINVPDEYFRDFLRGHLDGDGSITNYLDKYNTYKDRKYVNIRVFIRFISVSEKHIKWLRSMIINLTQSEGALYSTIRAKRVPMWTLKFSKKESLKLLQWIYYKNNLPSLERKRTMAMKILSSLSIEKRKIWTKV